MRGHLTIDIIFYRCIVMYMTSRDSSEVKCVLLLLGLSKVCYISNVILGSDAVRGIDICSNAGNFSQTSAPLCGN